MKQRGRAEAYLFITDYLIMVGTFGLALRFRHYSPAMQILDLASGHIVPQAAFIFLYAFAATSVFSLLNLYKRKVWLSDMWHTVKTCQASLIIILVYVMLKAVTKSDWLVESRLVTARWGLWMFLALFAHRLVLFPVLLRLALNRGLQRRVVLIGDSALARDFMSGILKEGKHAPLKVVGLLSNGKSASSVEDVPRLGEIADLPELIEQHGIEGTVITDPDLTHQQLMDLIEQCVRLFGWVDIHSQKYAVLHRNQSSDLYFDIPFVRLSSTPKNPLYFAAKWGIDFTGALIGLILLSPLLLFIALLIKLTSPGPVFYIHKRIGMNGQPFPFYKFRSMRVHADQDPDRAAKIKEHIQSGEQRTQKVVNESLITPVGRFIRKWAIDELPQLFNVLKGDMSLVGPRPLPPSEYGLSEEWQQRRFTIKPGCTGLWKLYAARETISYNETVVYDLYYARNMTTVMDLYIILMTVWVIIKGKADQ